MEAPGADNPGDAGPARRLVNRPTPYLITVTNVGDLPAEKVHVTDELHRNLVFLRASDGGRVVGDQVEWALGTLAPGETKKVHGKIYIVPADVPQLVKRYERDFPEQVAK